MMAASSSSLLALAHNFSIIFESLRCLGGKSDGRPRAMENKSHGKWEPVGRRPVLVRYARNARVRGTGGLGMQEYEGPVGANPAHRSLVLLRYARNAGVRGAGPPVPRTPAYRVHRSR